MITPKHIDILGIDPGIKALGWAHLRYFFGVGTCDSFDAGCITTKKSSKKQNLIGTVDITRRLRIIATELEKILQADQYAVIAAESPSFVRSSSTMFGIGAVWGVVTSLAVKYQIPVIQLSPQEIRELILGKGGSKQDVFDGVSPYLNGEKFMENLDAIKPAANRMHPMDALCAAYASIKTENFRLISTGVAIDFRS